MIIFWHVAGSLAAFVNLMKRGGVSPCERPRSCGACGEQDCFWAHGRYWRLVEEDGQSEELEIARFKCSQCGKTVSVLPWFVVPWRRYSMKTVADGIEGYARHAETYKEGATKLGAEGPSPAQLFCWVALLAERVKTLLLDVQAWCVSTSVSEEELLVCEATECPNSWKARISGKAPKLDDLAKFAEYGHALRQAGSASVVHSLGMRFLEDVEQMQQIFAHRSVWMKTPQRIKP